MRLLHANSIPLIGFLRRKMPTSHEARMRPDLADVCAKMPVCSAASLANQHAQVERGPIGVGCPAVCAQIVPRDLS